MLTAQSPSYEYQVGGSLPRDALSYVRRQADEELFQALLSSEFCYVLNSRQMGKSSLWVQTMHRLQAEGICCGAIDLTAIGTQEVTPEQWYASVVGSLGSSFQLDFNIRAWWRDRTHLSLVSRLSNSTEGQARGHCPYLLSTVTVRKCLKSPSAQQAMSLLPPAPTKP